MKNTVLKFCILSLLAVALQGLPGKVGAQDNDKPATENKETRSRSGVTPFHGNLKAVDQDARTFSVGSLILHVTTDTKFVKDGKPATLQDGIVGESVGGAYKKMDDGKLNATLVRFGPKAESEGAKEKSK